MSEILEGGIPHGELNVLLADVSSEPLNGLYLIVSDNMETIKTTFEKLGVKEYIDLKDSILQFFKLEEVDYPKNCSGIYKEFRKDSWIYHFKEKIDTPKHFYFLVDDPFDTLDINNPMNNIDPWTSSLSISRLAVLPYVFSYILTIKDENNFKLNKWRSKTNEYTKQFYKEEESFITNPQRPEPNVVNVTITGAVNSGKTGIAVILMQALQAAGFNAGNIKIVNQDDDIYGKFLMIDAVINSLKEKNVTINIIDNNGHDPKLKMSSLAGTHLPPT